MKRLILVCLFVAAAFAPGWAKEVPEAQAKEYATAFFQARSPGKASARSIQAVGQPHNAYYLVNFAPRGWALVSADDAVKPVIAYSLKGSLDMNRAPDNMKFMLRECERQIAEAITEGRAPHRLWENPRIAATRTSANEIEPLIQVNWNQSAPYNEYCPKKEALVGCVAVAMGQAMSVQQYPPRPRGEVSYTSANYGGLSINFDNERAYNWDDIMSGADKFDEVARMLYHAGMSVKMDYGKDGSGIPASEVSRISNALRDNFSYPDVSYAWKERYQGDWEQFLINELNAGRAVVYNAIDTKAKSGHSFNVDGYDGEGYFHINWGWGGHGDSYFSIDGLRDSYQGFNYDASHVAVVGIGSPDRILKSISLSNNRIEEGLPAGAVVGSVLVNGEEAKPSFQVDVHGTYDSKTGTHKPVPFRYEDGMLKATEVLSAKNDKWEIEITVTDSESETSLTQGFRVMVEKWKSLEETTRLRFDRETGIITLTTKHNVSYIITSEAGTVLSSGNLEPLPELLFNINILSAGKNTIELKCADEVKKVRIVTK